MRLTRQLSAALCGLALAVLSAAASAQQQTPAPAPDFRAKIISAERALAGPVVTGTQISSAIP